MELILQTNRQAMKGSNRLLVLLEILVRFLSLRNSLVEEDLVQAVDQLMGHSSTVTERFCNFHSRPLSTSGLF